MEGAGSPRSYRALLTDRRFLPFFLGESAGSTGYAVYAITVPWLADQIGGPRALGLALLVEFGIYSLSFLAGPFIDRVRSLRTVLVVGYLGQAALAALLGVIAAGGHLSVVTLLAIVVPLSAVWDFTWTAQNAAPPRLVPSSDLLRANGIIGAVSGGNQVADTRRAPVWCCSSDRPAGCSCTPGSMSWPRSSPSAWWRPGWRSRCPSSENRSVKGGRTSWAVRVVHSCRSRRWGRPSRS
ncbi:MAG: hypothetical protein L3K08_00545 [Thermoplasmata archaeon]|nr:hypothetical protein [Thermoplasmata archaeon]